MPSVILFGSTRVGNLQELPWFRGLGVSFFQDGGVGVGVLPQRQEIVVGEGTLGGIALQGRYDPHSLPISPFDSQRVCRTFSRRERVAFGLPWLFFCDRITLPDGLGGFFLVVGEVFGVEAF